MIHRLAGLSISGLLLTNIALALDSPADGPPSQGGSDSASIDEIVVTANKRSQNLQDVAMTATVLSGQQLAEQKITSLADIASTVPGLSYSPTETNTPVFTLRGIGFDGASLSAYPTVSVYLDEVPLAFPVLSTQGAFDLQRIEVLKGPQGTLYGENSTGGAINYIAAKPTDEFSTGEDASFSRFNTVEANGFVSGPLSDTLKARVAVHYIHGDDWQYSYTRNDTLGRTEALAGRAIVEWTPLSNLRVSMELNAWLDRSDPQAGQLVAIYPQQPAYATPALVNYPYPPANNRAADWSPNGLVNPIGQSVDFRPRSNRHATQAMLRIDYDVIPSLTLTSLSSYIRFNENQAEDYDGMALDDDDFPSNTGSIGSLYQEFRASNGAQGPLRWIAGTNFQSSHVDEDDAITYADSVNNNPTLNNFFQNGYRSTTFRRDYAFFGNLEYDVTSKLTLQGGARYTNNLTRTDICNYDLGDGRVAGLVEGLSGLLTGQPATIGPNGCVSLDFNNVPGPVYHGSLEQSNVSWRLGPQYKISDTMMLYANVSRGFKAGGFPTISASSFNQLTPVTQESVVAYEAGLKSSFLDQRLTFNSALFYYDYRNKQIEGKVLDPVFGVLGRLVNVPRSIIYGAEFEANYRPTRGLNLTAALTYIGSKVDEYAGVNAIGQTQDFAGDRIPFVPQWQGRLDGEYTWHTGGIEPFVGADVDARTWSTTYIGGENIRIPVSAIDSTAAGATNPFEIKGYAVVNMRAGLGWDDGKWRAMLWGKNVFNNYYFTNSIYSFDTAYRLTGRPATYGISVFYRH